MFEIEGKTYELKYNLKRIGMIENAIGGSLMGKLVETKGMFSVNDLTAIFAYGLKEVDADAFVPVKKGMEYANTLIEKEGFVNLDGAVLEKLQEDCPFFFQAG